MPKKKVVPLRPKPKHDEKVLLALLLDGMTKLVELEPALRKKLRCSDFVVTRCRYANLHPTFQKPCENCELDRRLDEVMSTLREAAALTKR